MTFKGTSSKPIPPEKLERIRKAAADNPDLTKADLARRFGVSDACVRRALQNNAATGGLTFPRGTSVKVPSLDGSPARTGVVVDDAPPFPWRDHRRVDFDADGGKASDLVPVQDLRRIKPSDRPAHARPREQVPLFTDEGSKR